jgi:hypothetical protein
VHKGFWCVNLKGGVYVEDVGIDGRIILRLIFDTYGKV